MLLKGLGDIDDTYNDMIMTTVVVEHEEVKLRNFCSLYTPY